MTTKNQLVGYLNYLITGVMVVTAFLLPFFKPAVTISMVSLFGLSLIRWYLDELCRPAETLSKLPRWLPLMYMFFLGWIILSAAWSTDVREAMRQIYNLGQLLLVPVLLIVNIDLIKHYFKWIFRAALAGCILAGLVTLWYYIYPEQIPVGEGYYYIVKKLSEPRNFEKFGAFSPFVDRLYFSYLTGFLLLGLWLRLLLKRGVWMEYVALVILVPLMVVLGGRGAQLALLVALSLSGIVFVWRPSPKKGAANLLRLGFILAGMLLTLGVIVFGLSRTPRYAQIRWELQEYQRNPEDHERIANHTVLLRLLSWDHNLRLIRRHPLQGVGVGDYHRAMGISYEEEGLKIPVHNNQQFLYFGVIAGLPALGLFVFIFLVCGYYAWRFGEVTQAGLVVIAVWSYLCGVMLLDSPLNYVMPAFLLTTVWFGVFFAQVHGDKGTGLDALSNT